MSFYILMLDLDSEFEQNLWKENDPYLFCAVFSLVFWQEDDPSSESLVPSAGLWISSVKNVSRYRNIQIWTVHCSTQ